MKLYRVQAKYKNIYVDEMLEAKNDKAALEDFAKKVDSGDVTEKPGAGFEDPNFLFLTFFATSSCRDISVNLLES